MTIEEWVAQMQERMPASTPEQKEDARRVRVAHARLARAAKPVDE